MNTYFDCYPCFFTQALKTSRMITSDEKVLWKILSEVAAYLSGLPIAATPPEIGRKIYRLIAKNTGVDDPYLKIKERCTRQALALYPEMKRQVETSADPLMTAARAAIAGNIIDFGVTADFDLTKDVEKVFNQELAINAYDDFCSALKRAERIIYLGDNAGETVFDRILIEEIRKPVTFVVREKPVINDAVRKDAVEAGIDLVADIVSSGCDAPGTILELCSPAFLEFLQKADMIISKGQGNYEGLSDVRLPIFFLLKAKCQVIARDLGVEQGSIVLKRHNPHISP